MARKAERGEKGRSPRRGKQSAPASGLSTRLLRATVHGAHLGERIRELEDELADLRSELERSERRVEAMKQIGRALGSNLELEPLLQEIVARTTDLLEADRSTLFLLDAASDELWSTVLQGGELREIRLKLGVGVAGWVAQHGRPAHLASPYEDARFNPDFDRRSGYVTRCMLAWPVFAASRTRATGRPGGHRIVGVIQVLNKNVGAFSPTDERLLEAIASEIGVALEVSRLYREALERTEALERARRELMLLFETERAISQSEDLREMLGSILGTALTALSSKAGAIHLLDERGLRLEVVAHAGASSASLKNGAIQVGEGLVGNVVKTGQPVALNDLVGTRRGRITAKSIVAVPVRARASGITGVFELINKKDKQGFTPEDIKALTVVAAQAGRAIAGERRRKERARSERLTTIGRMLSGIIHDLRTPMTLISGYTQVMALSESVADREQYAHLVLKQVDMLSAMTKDLLAFARGERSLLIRKVYVHRFLSEMKDYLEKEFEGSGVRLALDCRYRGAARFDETKMRRVFYNIARNAREAMPGGGTFTVRVDTEREQLRIDFADTGSGIPAELEGRLFEPFQTAGKVGGTGLGLAMVKQIAEEHRGTVGYVSSPRQGTTFTFRLPLDLR